MNKKFKLQLEYNCDKHEEYKQLCQYVYHEGVSLPDGYKVIDIVENPKNGFYAEVVKKENNVVIVGLGTDIKSVKDLLNDVDMVRKRIPSQYYSYMAEYEKIKELYPDNIKITFTGHSLAGSLAQLASQATGEDAVTFAPYGTGDFSYLIENRKPSRIINYLNEKDPIAVAKLNKQVGEIRIIECINDKFAHELENWGNLDEYIPYTQSPNDSVNIKTIEYIQEKRYFIKKLREKDDKNVKSKHNSTPCVGSYHVSGYTRADGTKVSDYTRTCGAKHNRNDLMSFVPKTDDIPKIDNIPKSEVSWWIKTLI